MPRTTSPHLLISKGTPAVTYGLIVGSMLLIILLIGVTLIALFGTPPRDR